MGDEQSIRDRLTKQEAIMQQVAKDVAYLRRLLVGDGDHRSLTVRMDRVERSQRLAKRWGWLLAGGVVALVYDWLRRMVTGQHN